MTDEKQPTDAPANSLFEVLPGLVLHIPERCDRDTPLWLRAGGVVDMSDPVIAMFVRGQEHKLRPVTDPKKVAAPLPRQIEVMRAKYLGTFIPPTPPRAAMKQKADSRAAAAGIDSDIPEPDAPRAPRAGPRT